MAHVFAATDTQEMLGDLVARLLDGEHDFEARRRRLASGAADGLELWPQLASLGVVGAAFDEDAGGFGGSARDLAIVMAEFGRRLVVEPYLSNAVAGWALSRAGEHDLCSKVIGGQQILCFADQEAGAPGATRGVAATACAAGFALSGDMPLTRHAGSADWLVLAAQADGEEGLFLVEAGAEGLERTPVRLVDGAMGATIQLNEVPAIRIGDAAVLAKVRVRHRLGLAAETVGILRAVNQATFAYLQTRKQFGARLADFQALQHRAADMFMAAEEAGALVERAIAALDGDEPRAVLLAAAAKAGADRAGLLCGHAAIQLHGGMGVSDELDISHYARRLVAIRAEGGPASHHCLAIAGAPLEKTDADGFRAEVRSFVQAHLPEDIARKGRDGLELTKDDYVRWQKILRHHGYFAGAWPVEYGGGGWDLEKQLIFVQEAALNHAPMIIPYGVNMVGPVIYTFGDAAQKERYLPGILESDTWWCQGYSEPNAGSDLSSLKTTAVRDGDHYVVNGSKMWTTEAHWADMMHCLVRTDREAKAQRGISFLLIDMASPGIEIRPIVTIDGQHHTNEVFLDNVRVPVENRVGEEGQGWSIAKFLLANERVSIADTGPKLLLLRRLRAMLEQKPASPADVLLQARLGALATELVALAELEERYIANWANGGSKEGPEASLLKIRGTEILQALTELALEIEGPLGAVHDPSLLHASQPGSDTAFVAASAMAHQYLYGRCWSIFGGTNEIQRNIIARSLLS